jgi:aconitate hydratase
VKTSFAPGSPTTERYLRRAGLLDDLETLGFGIVGYGCTTCIGNSGPLTHELSDAVAAHDIFPVAVLSGNRNFPGRVHSDLEAGFLASPPMVVAFALAGDVDRDIFIDPIGHQDGRAVHLADLWPTGPEIDDAMKAVDPNDIAPAYDRAEASEVWRALQAPDTPLFPWNDASTYIRRPPFAAADQETCIGHFVAHPLLVLGDDMTTDHISPAGQIPAQGEAGRHLTTRGEDPLDLNVFASRRGNWEVMMRGMYTNRTLRNLLDETLPAGHTIHVPSGERLPVWQAAQRYKQDGEATVVIAGERYGMGSSRDWAAKGLGLLNVRVVLAKSFERIHRSNLIGMGILPLRLPDGIDPQQLALRPGDRIEIDVRDDNLKPRATLPVRVHRMSGTVETFDATLAVETGLEVELLRGGGIIPFILARALRARPAAH